MPFAAGTWTRVGMTTATQAKPGVYGAMHMEAKCGLSLGGSKYAIGCPSNGNPPGGYLGWSVYQAGEIGLVQYNSGAGTPFINSEIIPLLSAAQCYQPIAFGRTWDGIPLMVFVALRPIQAGGDFSFTGQIEIAVNEAMDGDLWESFQALEAFTTPTTTNPGVLIHMGVTRMASLHSSRWAGYDLVITSNTTVGGGGSPTTLYSRSGLLRSLDGGSSWTHLSPGLSSYHDMTVRSNGELIVSHLNVSKSTDGGQTFFALTGSGSVSMARFIGQCLAGLEVTVGSAMRVYCSDGITQLGDPTGMPVFAGPTARNVLAFDNLSFEAIAVGGGGNNQVGLIAYTTNGFETGSLVADITGLMQSPTTPAGVGVLDLVHETKSPWFVARHGELFQSSDSATGTSSARTICNVGAEPAPKAFPEHFNCQSGTIFAPKPCE